jgi:hypothetical protein
MPPTRSVTAEVSLEHLIRNLRKEFTPRIVRNGPTRDLILQIKSRIRNYIKSVKLEDVMMPDVHVSNDMKGIKIGFKYRDE